MCIDAPIGFAAYRPEGTAGLSPGVSTPGKLPSDELALKGPKIQKIRRSPNV